LEALKCSNSRGRKVSRLLYCSGDRLGEGGVCQRITVASEMVEVKEGERSASSRALRGVMGRSDVSIRCTCGRLAGRRSASHSLDNASTARLTMHGIYFQVS
jgi:hypothetical protein